MKKIYYSPIGIIHSNHTELNKIPIQPVYARGCKGWLEIFPEFAKGLKNIEGFSHIYLIYHLHCAQKSQLIVKPFLQNKKHGIFATRAPCRPNPIGLSIVKLLSHKGNILEVDKIDVLDGTPLLDIKPYTAKFDRIKTTRNGWQDGLPASVIKSGTIRK
mgnify:CR=1 FL=1